jgi:choline dehydrogenase-like flavoprotein
MAHGSSLSLGGERVLANTISDAPVLIAPSHERLTGSRLSLTIPPIMEREADVVVVGAGIVGCATAYFLARRGVRVVVVERGAVPGEQSRKNWGFVRQQGRDPLEMPLVMEANRLWRGLERELDADIEWIQGGNLAVAATEERFALFEQWLGTACESGLDTRLVSSGEIEALVPGDGTDLVRWTLHTERRPGGAGQRRMERRMIPSRMSPVIAA